MNMKSHFSLAFSMLFNCSLLLLQIISSWQRSPMLTFYKWKLHAQCLFHSMLCSKHRVTREIGSKKLDVKLNAAEKLFNMALTRLQLISLFFVFWLSDVE